MRSNHDKLYRRAYREGRHDALKESNPEPMAEPSTDEEMYWAKVGYAQGWNSVILSKPKRSTSAICETCKREMSDKGYFHWSSHEADCRQLSGGLIERQK